MAPATTAIPTATRPAVRETAILVSRALPAEAAAAVLFPVSSGPIPRADVVGEDAGHRGDGTTEHQTQSAAAGGLVAQPVDDY
jgi:hypothetical protein